MLADLLFSLRTLLRRPGFALFAALTVALGIGVNTAMFTIVNGVLWKPLPYADADRLVMFNEASLSGALNCSAPNLDDWRRRNGSFEAIEYAREFPPATLRLEKSAESLPTGYAHPGLFRVLGVRPQLGRLFDSQEDRAGVEPVGVISHQAWQRYFGGDPGIVGRRVRIHISFQDRTASSMTVAGVLPPEFRYENIDLWLPFEPFRGQIDDQRGNHWFRGIGKLKAGVPLARAVAELDGIARDLEREYPATNRGVRPMAAYLNDYYAGRVKTPLLLLLGAVGFVMLIACGNAVHLVLTRTLGRGREIAVRLALGAGRARLLRLLLAEGVWIAAAGGALGVLLAEWGVAWAVATQPRVLPRAATLGLDRTALAYALAVTCLTFLILGLAPLWRSSRFQALTALRSAGRGGSERGQRRLGTALIAAELAMVTVLLTGAGLTIESLRNLGRVDVGYRPGGVVAVPLSFPAFKFTGEGEFQHSLPLRILEEVRSIPGYQSAGFAEPFSVGGNGMLPPMTIPGRANPTPAPMIPALSGSPALFETLGISLHAGRIFRDDGETREAIVNEEFARRFFPGESPVGRTIDMGGPMPVVGVVANTRLQGQLSEVKPEVYWSQSYFGAPTLLVRVAGAPSAAVGALREAVRRAEPEIRIGTIRPLAETEGERTALQRFTRTLLLIFAALAALLAALGIYGVVSYNAAQRTREIGVRMALGARRSVVARLILGQTLAASTAGALAGAAGALWLAKFLASQLYGVTAHEPSIYLIAAGMVALMAVASAAMPVLRASRTDPAVCLRDE
jgi:putative ABC transport system permease protein